MTKLPSLPEKEWFTLEEIAQRWGTDRETLLHLAETRSLEVCRQISQLILDAPGIKTVLVWPTVFRIEPECVHLFCNHETEFPLVQFIGMAGEPEKSIPIDLDESGRPAAKFGRALDLLVTRSERDRFEAEHRVGAHAGAMPKDPEEVHDRKSLLNIIGALLELIKSPRTGRDSNNAVIAELLANWPEKYGISDRNLRGKFADAHRSLNEDG